MSKLSNAKVVDKTAASTSLLDQVMQVNSTISTDSDNTLLQSFLSASMKGTLKYNKNLSNTISEAIASIDRVISSQLAKVMADEQFSKLEGSWRGLSYMVTQTNTSTSLKIRMLSISKSELHRDLDRAVDFDQSQLYKKIYEYEYGTAGGFPYGAIIGDYEFSGNTNDIDMLRNISGVAAAGFCPFIASASSSMLGLNSWQDLSKPRDLAKIFETDEYIKWRSFRETDDSKFVCLTMPRVLARLPYSDEYKKCDSFDYNEFIDGDKNFCWMNASYVYASVLTRAFEDHGWCTSIRGAESGGKVENLPLYTYKTDGGDTDYQCPTEIGITDRREAELSQLGFLPLCHYKNTDYAVFFGAQTVNKPKVYDDASATANASISSRLPYIMATSRFAHYLKVIARDKIGSFMEASDVEDWLNNWILNYTNSNSQTNAELKAKYPLSDARVEVKEIAGQPGNYQAIAWLRPWLQMESLTTSMRLVANIPKEG